MTATAPAAPDPPKVKREPWPYNLHPVYRIMIRWTLIGVLTLVAFHSTLLSLVRTTTGGGIGGYVWVVPISAVLAAVGVARRHRTELPIHDRQTDIIVAIMGLVLALLLHAVLLQRYALYFHLLRLDCVALWLFVLSSSVALFGLRPIIRFAWVWLLLFAIFPLPYYILVILLGGHRFAAGVGTMVIAAFATATAVGRHARRAMLGSNFAWAVGLVILGGLGLFAPNAPLIVYQYVPALTAICLVGLVMFIGARRGSAKRVLDRKLEPLAAHQVWSAVPVVVIVGLLLAFVRLPDVGLAAPSRVDAMNFETPLVAPPGWHIVDTEVYGWVSRLYGRNASLVRQKMVADNGSPEYDKFSRPRAIMVDTITTTRPFSLNVYPVRMLYRVQGIRLSGTRPVDLGYGVDADLFTAVDDQILVTWDGLQWTWTNGALSRRVLVIAVDNHEDNAPFPMPTGGIGPTFNSMFTVLFRGNAVATDTNPNIKDDRLLTEFGHALARAQLEPLGIKP